MAAKDQFICNLKCICRQCKRKQWGKAIFHLKGLARAVGQFFI